MSLWQFAAAIGGVAAANGDGEERLNREEADALADLIKQHG
jgi:hypothetical protein